MAFGRYIWRWLACKLGPLAEPAQPEALGGSPLDLARALELAVDHCCLTPGVTAPPPASRAGATPPR